MRIGDWAHQNERVKRKAPLKRVSTGKPTFGWDMDHRFDSLTQMILTEREERQNQR